MAAIRKINSFYKQKGIFCIEGSWENDHRDKKSVVKALEFLECIECVKTIIKQCHNPATLKELLSDSMQAKYSKYPIVYLAFHGSPEEIFVGKRNRTISFDEVAEIIGDRANGKIIHFGCCSTLETDGWTIRRFLKKTNALAVSGYKKDIDFVQSTAFDLLYFQQCQKYYNIKKIKSSMKAYHSKLGKELGFVLHHRN